MFKPNQLLKMIVSRKLSVSVVTLGPPPAERSAPPALGKEIDHRGRTRRSAHAEAHLNMERVKATSDPRLKRELATRAFKLVRAAEALGGEEEVKSPWYLSHGDARGDSITQVFETKEAAINAACALVRQGSYVFEAGPIQEGQGGARLNGAEIRRIFDERARITE